MATSIRALPRPLIGQPTTAPDLTCDLPRAQPTSAEANHKFRANEVLIQACLDGDESAWKELVERYGRLVYSIPRRYGLSAVDADDVFQNVFTIVLRSLHSLRNQTCLSAWLITITHRETRRYAKGAPMNVELDETIPDLSNPASDQVQRWELQQSVREALEELNPCCRELLTALLKDEAPSYEELAKRLGMAVGSIGPTRARCFKKLESILVARGLDETV